MQQAYLKQIDDITKLIARVLDVNVQWEIFQTCFRREQINWIQKLGMGMDADSKCHCEMRVY